MSWDYRVLRYDDGSFGIHEVYYYDGEPKQCTFDAVSIVWEEDEDPLWQMRQMQQALEKPILNYEDF